MQLLQTIWSYNDWALEQIINSLKDFSEEEFLKDLGDGCGSVRDKLAHITAADEVWFQRIEKNPAPQFAPTSEFISIETWVNRAREVSQKYQFLVKHLGQDKIEEKIIYKNLKGVEFSTPLVEILMHVANHATYHRGQVASLIRRIKGKPPVTDMIEYFRTKEV